MVTTVLVLATAVLNSLCLSVFTGISLNLLAIASHNYLHQRGMKISSLEHLSTHLTLADNWRMYCFNLTGMNYREWRISHAISHHMYPNTIYDMETFTFEPLVRWLPKWKSKHQKLLSVVMLPLLWLVIIKLAILRR